MSKTVVLNPVMSKGCTRGGVRYEGSPSDFVAMIVPGQSIQVNRMKSDHRTETSTRNFSVGDRAEYDSYNLNYVGTITQISAKTVTFDTGRGYGGAVEVKRLSIHEFCWRNYDFDAAETAQRNLETMQYI